MVSTSDLELSDMGFSRVWRIVHMYSNYSRYARLVREMRGVWGGAKRGN